MNQYVHTRQISTVRQWIFAGVLLGGCILPIPQTVLAECFNLKVGTPVVVARDGEVIAKFLGGGQAVYSNDLYLDSPAGVFSGIIFNNQTSPVGSTVNLGTFKAGTELVFRIHVNDTGRDLITGLASRNTDGAVHARVYDSGLETFVGFEDLEAGGPPDGSCPNGGYNFEDLLFSFTNVRADAALGGSLTTLGLKKVLCRNLTTGQKTLIPLPAEAVSWDCAAAGLKVKGGDTIQETLLGTAR